MSHLKNITELCLLVIVLVCLQLITTEKQYLHAVQRTLTSTDRRQETDEDYTSQMLDPDDPATDDTDIRDTDNFTERVMKQRARIRRHGCHYIKLINDLIESNAGLDELMSFHRAIYELKQPENYDRAGSCRPPFLNTSSLRTLDKPWNILICLPPKCGTTNWQRAMTVLKMNYPDDLDVKEGDIKPEDLTAPKLYKELDTFIVSKGNKPRQREIDATFTKILNGRNPFTRLFSAWNDKSRSYLYPNGSLLPNTTKNWAEAHEIEHDFHRRYHLAWRVFEEEGAQRGRNVSWPAFVEYVAANPGDAAMNSHWKTQYHQCRICHFDYDYITHLENNQQESQYILRQLNIETKTHIPGKYSWSPASKDELNWQVIPRKTAIDVYRHYFADFVLLGYSPNDVMRFIDSTDHTREGASEQQRSQSRDHLLELRRSYFKNNQDFYCH